MVIQRVLMTRNELSGEVDHCRVITCCDDERVSAALTMISFRFVPLATCCLDCQSLLLSLITYNQSCIPLTLMSLCFPICRHHYTLIRKADEISDNIDDSLAHSRNTEGSDDLSSSF